MSSIFKQPSKREGYKLVGISVPSRVHEYLSLYILAKKTTKTKIFKELVDNWIKEQQKKETDDALLQEIIQCVTEQWKADKKNLVNSSSLYLRFVKDLETELMNKGLSESNIRKIITSIKQ